MPPRKSKDGKKYYVGALWKKKGFLSGTISLEDDKSLRLAVFPNGYKKPDDNRPDFNITVFVDDLDKYLGIDLSSTPKGEDEYTYG